jgi:cell wall-associated NlpC family hydrolase
MEGADCWGMVQICYSKFMGVEVPGYDDVYYEPGGDTDAADFIADQLDDQQHFERVTSPERGCFALLSVAGNPIHVGFMLDNRQMIHTRSGVGPSVDDVTTIKWKGRILGFYNYRPANDR